MEQITIDIQLDPIKDGIKVPEQDVSRPDAHAVILGTNGKMRQISMKEAENILDQMTNSGAGTNLGKSDYIAFYNKDKLFKADGEDYLVGSVLIFQRSGNVLKAIPDDEIGDLLEVAMRAAKPRLIHIEMNLLNNFKRLGVQASTLNGAEDLELIHQQFHMGDDEKFFFDWKWLVGSGLSIKDFVAPAGINFKNGRLFQMGNLYGTMSFLSITASDISDRMLADFLGMESSQIVTMHLQSVDQTEAIKTVKHTITELDRSKIEEQKKAVRAGYDMDIIPSDLATYGKDAKALLKELQSQNERMFLLTFLVLNTGKTEQELENNVFQANSIAQKHNCNLIRLNFQQEQGLIKCWSCHDSKAVLFLKQHDIRSYDVLEKKCKLL